MRILMVGLDNSGKTTIVLRINDEDTTDISPTLGFKIKTLNYQRFTLHIWDAGGQRTIRAYWRNYFEQTDVRRQGYCKMELNKLLKEGEISWSFFAYIGQQARHTGCTYT